MTIARVATDVTAGAASGNPTVAYQAGIFAGDLILVNLGCRGTSTAPTFTTPPGFTQLGTDNNTNTRAAFYWKIATGTESGSNLVVTVAGGAGWGIVVGVRRSTNGFSATPISRFTLATQAFSVGERATTVFTTPQLTTVPAGAWSQSEAVYGSAGGVASVSGAGWSSDGSIATSGAGVSSGSNNTGTGSVAVCTHTLTASANCMGCSYCITEQAAAPGQPPLMVCEA